MINRSSDQNVKTDPETAQMLRDFVFFREFGWTPRQIEELSEYEYDAIYTILETSAEIQKKEEAKSKRKKTDPQNLVQN